MSKQLSGQPGQQPMISGPINSVPCPHCGHRCDFRTTAETQLLDTGNEYVCDRCQRFMQVIRVTPVTMLTVRKSSGRKSVVVPKADKPTQAARTMSPTEHQRLLRGRR